MNKKHFVLGFILPLFLGIIGVMNTPLFSREIDLIIGVGSFVFCSFFIFDEYSKQNIYAYSVSERGSKINQMFFKWEFVQNIHLLKESDYQEVNFFLVFDYEGVQRKFPLNELTLIESEIKQILYIYQRLWIRNHRSNDTSKT